MSSVHNILSFYKDCFEEENKGGGIANFLSAKVERHLLIKGREEHLSGFLPYTPIQNGLAEKFQSQLVLYQKEKELVYGSIFLLGEYMGMHGKPMKLIAPLLLYTAQVVLENELYYVKADLKNPSFNPAVIDLLKSNYSDFDEDAFYKQLPRSAVSSAISGKLARLIDKNLPSVDSSLLVDYPNNITAYKVKKLLKSIPAGSYQLVPASAIGLVRKSVKTRSAMAELNAMSDSSFKLSQPISSLFDKGHKQKITFRNHITNPVAVLSDAQQNILDAAVQYNLSVAIGPPGTGKSYTIANLAINMMSQGKSVLICSRNDGAVEVIENQIEAILGSKDMCVRGGRNEEIKALKNRLQFMLSRGSISESHRQKKKADTLFFVREREQRMFEIRSQLKRYVSKFERADIEELTEGTTILKYDSSNHLWNRIMRFYLDKKVHFDKEIPLWEVTDLYLSLLEDMIQITKEHTNKTYRSRINNTIIRNRQLLKNYLQSLRATNTARQKAFLESIHMPALFHVFPIWLTTTKDVGELLPLKKELFDVVIIDEASQCDIATSLPLLQRAKKAVIVGDPKQLRHLSFLSRGKQQLFQKKNLLGEVDSELHNYRQKSILDIAEESIKYQSQSSFLDEHYRSKPEIIAFSNREFYFDQLHIMTQNKVEDEQALFHIEVGGTRDKSGANSLEIKSILLRIKDIVRNESEIGEESKQSIGILSPFRSQVDQIISCIEEEFSIAEIQSHKILVGTAHSFQGEERDLMFLSFVLDQESSASSFHFLNQHNVLNVSITRARNAQYIFTSFNAGKLKLNSILRKYIESLNTRHKRIEEENSIKDKFCEEVMECINAYGLKTHQAYSIAGIKVDVAVEKDKQLFAIDLVGFPGPFQETIELYKYKALLRAGIKMIPIPYALWRFKKESCEQKIADLLGIKMIQSKAAENK